MNCEETLQSISAAGLTMTASETKDKLRVFPPENLTPELVDSIREHKAEIIRIIQEDQRRREDRALEETGIIQSERQVFQLAREHFEQSLTNCD